jgi:hypothetical protein
VIKVNSPGPVKVPAQSPSPAEAVATPAAVPATTSGSTLAWPKAKLAGGAGDQETMPCMERHVKFDGTDLKRNSIERHADPRSWG